LLPEPHDGVISLQTGGGKTVCALYIASQLKVPTIVLVHNTFLRDQWVERIKAFLPKARIGFVQGDEAQTENVEFIVNPFRNVGKPFGFNNKSGFKFLIKGTPLYLAPELVN
jgi:hypothetical protein